MICPRWGGKEARADLVLWLVRTAVDRLPFRRALARRDPVVCGHLHPLRSPGWSFRRLHHRPGPTRHEGEGAEHHQSFPMDGLRRALLLRCSNGTFITHHGRGRSKKRCWASTSPTWRGRSRLWPCHWPLFRQVHLKFHPADRLHHDGLTKDRQALHDMIAGCWC